MEHTRLGYLAAPVTKSGDITTIVLTISRNTYDRLNQDVLRSSEPGPMSISNYYQSYYGSQSQNLLKNYEK